MMPRFQSWPRWRDAAQVGMDGSSEVLWCPSQEDKPVCFYGPSDRPRRRVSVALLPDPSSMFCGPGYLNI